MTELERSYTVEHEGDVSTWDAAAGIIVRLNC